MGNLRGFILADRKNEDGYVMVACLAVLMIVTIIGVMSIRTTNSDLGISTNRHILGRSFYAAEAARAFVRYNPELYGSGHITSGTAVGFPDAADTTITHPIISGEQEAFRGTVEYLNSSVVPRGSGFQVGKFKAHNYRMICEGHGPRESITRIEAGFFRIGF
jgi:hypothetical protein